jgi:hypothetical protein
MMAVPAKGRKGVAKGSCRERLHLVFFIAYRSIVDIARYIRGAMAFVRLQGEQEEMAGNNDGRWLH